MGIAIPSFPRAQTNRFQRFRVVCHLLVRGAQRPRQPPAHRQGREGVPPRRQQQQVRAKVLTYAVLYFTLLLFDV